MISGSAFLSHFQGALTFLGRMAGRQAGSLDLGAWQNVSQNLVRKLLCCLLLKFELFSKCLEKAFCHHELRVFHFL